MILYFKFTESMFQIYLQVYFSIYLQTIKWNKFWILERFEIYGVFEYEEEEKTNFFCKLSFSFAILFKHTIC